MAYQLNGTSDYFPLGFTPVNQLPLTMACWFNPDDVATKYALMGLGVNSGGNERISLIADGSAAGDPVGAEARNSSSTTATATTSTSFQTGSWQHAAGVFTSTTSRRAFLNGGGAASNSTSISFASAIDRLHVGARLSVGVASNLFKGKIAEAAMWNVALTDDEVAALAQGISPNLIRPGSLWFYAPLVNGLQNLRGGILSSAGSPTLADHIPIIQPRRPLIGQPTIAPSLSAGASSFSVSGQNAGLLATRRLAADAATVAVDGQAANFASGKRIGADVASFSMFAQDAQLRTARVLRAANSNIALAAQSANLNKGSLVALPTTPSVRYHAAVSSITLGGDSRVTAITDIMALADASGSAGNGPKVGTDPLGRKYLDFNFDPNGAGQHWLTIATTLANVSSQACAVFAVGRFFSQQSGVVFSIGQNGNSPPNTGGPLMQCTGPGAGLQQRPYAGPNTAGSQSTKIGTQLCVVGSAGRTVGNGGVRVWMNRNGRSPNTPVALTAGTGQGAEVGRNSNSPTGTFLNAHIYELIVFNFNLTDSQGDAIATALADGWGIPDIVHDVVVEGDSISAGVDDRGIARWLSEPSLGLPATTRVVMSARSGSGFTKSTTQNPTYRRDLSGSCLDLATYRVPGDVPSLTIQIGRNDITNDATADAAYSSLVAYLNTTTTGVLQRGFKVAVGANIAEGSTLGITSSVLRLRNKILDPQFLVDCNAGPGQTYYGRLRVANLPGITSGAKGTVFYDLADTTDTDIYQSDGLHPWEAGEQLEVYGGDTPTNGYKYALQMLGGTMQASNSTVALAGQNAGLAASRRIGGGAAIFALPGQAAGLLAARRLQAGNAALSLSAQIAGLRLGRGMPAAASAIGVAGQNATLRAGRLLRAGVSLIALTGQDAALSANVAPGRSPAPPSRRRRAPNLRAERAA